MKELLSDTGFTKSWDNRFSIAAANAKVAKIEVSEKGANVRVIFLDREDRNGQPLISKPIPVLQIASKAKRSFTVPRLGDNVFVVKLPNGTSNYAVIGSYYTKNDPPPVTDPMLDYAIYDDGSTMQFDANNGQLDWNLKGDYNFKGDKDFNLDNTEDVNLTNDGDVNIEPQGDVLIEPDGIVDIEAATIKLVGNVVIQGNITHTGNMTTSGTHTDSVGPHFHGGGMTDLEKRIAALEQRVAQLEGVILKIG